MEASMENKYAQRKETSTEFMLMPENCRAQINFLRKNVTTELSSDFTLPDYYPEIRKVLCITARLSPISRYVGGSNIEFSGRADYDMVYVSGEGKPASVPLGTDFSFSVPADIPDEIDWENSGEVFADTECGEVHCRVSSPRKINVKSRLRSLVRLYGEVELSPELKNIKQSSEKLCSEESSAILHRYMSEITELEEDVPIDGNNENINVISCDGAASISESFISDGGISCRGDVLLTAVYENTDEEKIYTISRKVPFSQTIDIPSDARQATSCAVKGITGELKAEVSDGKLTLGALLTLEADTALNTPLSVTRDIFIPACQSDTDYRDFNFETVEKCANASHTLSESVPIADFSMSSESEIISSSATARTDDIQTDNGKACINGSCRICIISKNGGEYSSGEVTLPFTYDIGSVGENEWLSMASRPTVTAVRCRMEGEDVLCEVDIALSHCITSRKKIKIAENITVRASEEVPQSSGITVYYPKKGETLWEVARSFSVPLRRLAAANDLPSARGDEDVSGKRFIMIY